LTENITNCNFSHYLFLWPKKWWFSVL